MKGCIAVISYYDQAFIICIFINPRFYNYCLLINIAIPVVLFSQVGMEHCNFVETPFEFLILISIKRYSFQYHLWLLALHFYRKYLFANVIWIFNRIDNLNFASSLMHKCARVIENFQAVTNDYRSCICKESLQHKFCSISIPFVKDITKEWHFWLLKVEVICWFVFG